LFHFFSYVDPQKKNAPDIDTLRGDSDSSLLFGLPTEPSKAALGQSKCQSQQVDTSMFMQVEVD